VPLKEDLFLKEILEQPQALRTTMKHWIESAVQARVREKLGKLPPSRVIFTGMGSSLNACLPACVYLNHQGVAATALESAELLYYYPAFYAPENLLVVVSQSGESVEPVRLMEALPDRVLAISVTNGLENTIARRSRLALDMRAGPELTVSSKTYVCAQLALFLLACAISGSPIDKPELEETIGSLETFLDGWRARIQPLVDMLQPCDYLSLLGRGPSLASALDGAQTLKEAGHRLAEAVSGGQFRHGPLEIVSPRYGYMVFPGHSRTRDLMLRLGKDIAGYGARVAFIGNGDAPKVQGTVWIPTGPSNSYLLPILEIVPVQLLAWSLASLEGRTVDGFAKMGKVVRTE
jgi:glutamine---fructose-6-phosphate transaminase (isomerizing)